MSADDELNFGVWGEVPAWGIDDDEEYTNNATNTAAAGTTTTLLEESSSIIPFGAQHLLILIDCRKEMFQRCIRTSDDVKHGDINKDDDSATTTPFDAALRAAQEVMRMKVNHVAMNKSGKRDGVGVMLFNTRRRRQRQQNNERARAASNTHVVKREEGASDILNNEEQEHEQDQEQEQESDDESEDERFLESSTYELIELAPPGIQAVLDVQRCLPRRMLSSEQQQQNSQSYYYQHYSEETNASCCSGTCSTKRERDLRAEFEDINDENRVASVNASSMGNCTLSSLRTALHAGNKVFNYAK